MKDNETIHFVYLYNALPDSFCFCSNGHYFNVNTELIPFIEQVSDMDELKCYSSGRECELERQCCLNRLLSCADEFDIHEYVSLLNSLSIASATQLIKNRP